MFKSKAMIEKEKRINDIEQETVTLYFTENIDVVSICGCPVVREQTGKRLIYVKVPSGLADYQVRSSGGRLVYEKPGGEDEKEDEKAEAKTEAPKPPPPPLTKKFGREMGT